MKKACHLKVNDFVVSKDKSNIYINNGKICVVRNIRNLFNKYIYPMKPTKSNIFVSIDKSLVVLETVNYPHYIFSTDDFVQRIKNISFLIKHYKAKSWRFVYDELFNETRVLFILSSGIAKVVPINEIDDLSSL